MTSSPQSSVISLHSSKERMCVLTWKMPNTLTFLALAASTFAAPTQKSSINTTVDLGYSKYLGTNNGNDVTEWLGIRYAAPPLGNLRFRAPQSPLVNDTLQIANQHGGLCHSSPSTSLSPNTTEDCLFLDVYAPTDASKLHPVFVYFQGGGFNSLSNPNLNGTSLIVAGDHDIVVVTFNYRVGPWGFLTSKEVVENGDTNVGLKDQRFLLEWVQENIEKFGGDKSHVTIGGASAGGASVDLQLSAYGGRDDGLFHASAAESQSFGAQLTVSESQYQYDGLVERTGCAGQNDTLACLRELDISVIAENNINLPTPGGAGASPVFMWSNVVDGDFSSDYTYKLFTTGQYVKLPAIYGDDTNEGTVFTPKSINSSTDMTSFLKNNFVKLTDDQISKIHQYYPKGPQYPNAGSYWSAAALAYGEMRYNCPGIYLSGRNDVLAPSLGNWNYHWDVLSSENAANGFGVTHTAELASIWGYSKAPDSALIPSIQAYWTSFIRSKDPNTYKLKSTPKWKEFSITNYQRILFQAQNATGTATPRVKMESIPDKQLKRCNYLSSIGVSITQ
ncbi:9a1562fc-5002-4a32-8486-2208e186d697 [Sclerotinia trifoliorum]|uniref:Carboxylic ester hydrolase n=1 Tax=Sclerotinia trifoliorum TaxID=28548 RepID=A0A8H2VWF3_9HELO|nr:9a1562fc-5002-4a32-8486-2208e186d697 [Sclerotinia trifoliorum]